MKLRTFTVFLWGYLIASAAVAGEENRMHIKIDIDNDDEGHTAFEFDSDKSNIDLRSMAVGESQNLTGDDGQDVTVLRTARGYEFDIDGEKVELVEFNDDDCADEPHNMHESENVIVHIDKSGEHEKQVERDVRVVKKEVEVTN